MTVSFKHAFTSAKVDGTDSTLIQPSNWNAEHVLTLAAGKVLGRDASGSGAAQELAISVDATQQSMIPPSGNTASRPATAVAGMMRYNTTTAKFEGYNGAWGTLGGGALISDTAPSSPVAGDLWWKSSDGQMYIYYDDGTSTQWVIANYFTGLGTFLPLTGGVLSGNLGVGTATAARRLHVTDDTFETQVVLRENDASGPQMLMGADSTVGGSIINATSITGGQNNLIFQNGGSEKARIDTLGNVGIGGAPMAFDAGGHLNFADSAVIGWRGPTNYISTNVYVAGGVWKYNTTQAAAIYQQTAGQHIFYRIPSGTAGTTATPVINGTFNANGDFLITGSGGLGYGTGSGGTVTQLTNKSTNVTLNKTNGQVVMAASALASGASAVFSMNNTTVVGTDAIALSIGGSGFGGNYTVAAVYCVANQVAIRVTNIGGGSLSEAVVVNFAIIKAVTA